MILKQTETLTSSQLIISKSLTISDKYLPGILIGYINEIEADSNNITAEVPAEHHRLSVDVSEGGTPSCCG